MSAIDRRTISGISTPSERTDQVAGARWGLSYPVDIGPRLRAERERRGISLRELAKRVSLSPSLISQIETGKARPSVGSLYALTTALGLSVDRLFTEEAKSDPEHPNLVVRGTNRKVIELENGVRWERLTAASHADVDFLAVEYAPGGASATTMMRHAGKEYGIVLSGALTVTVNFDDYLLGPGDSIAFPSTTPHRLWNAGEEPVHAIWCVTGRHRSTPTDV